MILRRVIERSCRAGFSPPALSLRAQYRAEKKDGASKPALRIGFRRVNQNATLNDKIDTAVMPGFMPGIHCRTSMQWIAGINPAMTPDLSTLGGLERDGA